MKQPAVGCTDHGQLQMSVCAPTYWSSLPAPAWSHTQTVDGRTKIRTRHVVNTTKYITNISYPRHFSFPAHHRELRARISHEACRRRYVTRLSRAYRYYFRSPIGQHLHTRRCETLQCESAEAVRHREVCREYIWRPDGVPCILTSTITGTGTAAER